MAGFATIKARSRSGLACFGGDRRDRTADLLIANQTLYQLSYAPEGGNFSALAQ